MSILLKAKGSGSGEQVLRIEPGKSYALGRSEDSALVLEDNKVSRRHAEIRCENGACVITDMGSSFGTFVNGRKISTSATLKAGDELMLGNMQLTVAAEDDAAPAAKKAPRAAPAAPAEDEASFDVLDLLYTEEMLALKRRIHEQILNRMKLTEIATRDVQDGELRGKLETALDAVLRECRHEIASGLSPDVMRQSLMDELVEYGPITPLLRDPTITEVMVNGPSNIFVERAGKLTQTRARFFDSRHLLTIIARIVEPLGRHIDEASPMVDARLPDGSRVNAIISPLALDGPSLTIRKFSTKKLTSDDLIKFGSIIPVMAEFLEEAVRARQNILISGGTGSGKTTLLNIMSQCIPEGERIVTIEDSAELKLYQSNLVRLESRPPNVEGKGRINIRDLVVNALRMRPDRIIVGECRSAEALDMLQAMNTGHDGSLTTVHANNPRDALMRLENMVMMAGYDLPSTAIREQISSAINLVVQQSRMPDGSRKVTYVSEITGREGDVILMQDIFQFEQTGFDQDGVKGSFKALGNVPRFVEELKMKGDLKIGMEIFNI